MDKNISLTIDGRKLEAKTGQTILEVAVVLTKIFLDKFAKVTIWNI